MAKDKKYLDHQLKEIDNGDAEFLTLDQLDLMLDERIKKQEVKILLSFLLKLADQDEYIARDKPTAAKTIYYWLKLTGA
jgi:hypothetical protein